MLDTTQAIDYCRPSDLSSLAGALERICAAFAGARAGNIRCVSDSEVLARASRASLTNAHEAA